MPTKTEKKAPKKKSFRELMGPLEAFLIPAIVTMVLIFSFMLFLAVFIKVSLPD